MAAFAALVFDLGGVIVPHDNEQLYRALAARCRPAPPPAAIAAAARDPGYERGQLPIAHLHRRLVAEFGYAGEWEAFAADWCCHLAIDWAMLAYVERLAAARRVLLFSNTNHEHWQHLLELSDGRLGSFEAHLSHEIGDAKPALSAFRRVAARAGIDPARSLFVDDRPENVAAARQAGFAAEVFTDQAAFERYLSAVETAPAKN
ncbi:MAG TPA: HAD-IA family hydrolase [Stellaceae bacterium]|nr:HAD-IA family hydrolase [Stellaceae bacterium]